MKKVSHLTSCIVIMFRPCTAMHRIWHVVTSTHRHNTSIKIQNYTSIKHSNAILPIEKSAYIRLY